MKKLIGSGLVALLVACTPKIEKVSPVAPQPPVSVVDLEYGKLQSSYLSDVNYFLEHPPEMGVFAMGDRFVYFDFQDNQCEHIDNFLNCLEEDRTRSDGDFVYAISSHGAKYEEFVDGSPAEIAVIDFGENGFGEVDVIDFTSEIMGTDYTRQPTRLQRYNAMVILSTLTSLVRSHHDGSGRGGFVPDYESIPGELEMAITNLKLSYSEK